MTERRNDGLNESWMLKHETCKQAYRDLKSLMEDKLEEKTLELLSEVKDFINKKINE